MSRFVPWMCRQEWLTAYNNLYNFEDTLKQAQGMKQVLAWKSKCNGQLPVAIETTVSLIAAILDDISSKSPYGAQLTMSMAVVRFVNSMVDLEQKGAYARSVQSIADDIGIPDWLVDLRHEATHAALPSLQVLRTGCEFSLEWLNQHYWRAQIAEIQENEATLRDLLQRYVEQREKVLSLHEKKQPSVKHVVKEIVSSTMQYDMWEFVFDVLTGENGLFYPSTEILEILNAGFNTTNKSNVISSFAEVSLPREAISIWKPLFKAIDRENPLFLCRFVERLMRKLCRLHRTRENQKMVGYIDAWVRFLLSNCNEHEKWTCEVDILSLLEACLLNYSPKHTNVFLEMIMEKHGAKLTASVKQKLKGLRTLKFHACASEPLEMSDVARNLRERYKNVSGFGEKLNKGEKQGWEVSEKAVSCFAVGEILGGPDRLGFQRLYKAPQGGDSCDNDIVMPTTTSDDSIDQNSSGAEAETVEDTALIINPDDMDCESPSKTLDSELICSISDRIAIF